jgi:2-haloacid dehalogenase
MCYLPRVRAWWAELGLNRVERQRRQVTNRVQAEQLEAVLDLRLEHEQVAHGERCQECLRLFGRNDAGPVRFSHARSNGSGEFAVGEAETRAQQRRDGLKDRLFERREITVELLQPTQIEEEITVIGRFDGRAHLLKVCENGFKNRRGAHRVRLEDHRVRTQRDDFAQRQARADASRLGFRGAQLNHLALARRATENQRAAIPLRVAQDLHPQWELGDPDASDANIWPGGHAVIIEHTFGKALPFFARTQPQVPFTRVLNDSVRALVFDVFGTCVDWRGSIIRALEATGQSGVDWASFADEWRRDGYIHGIADILSGKQPYVSSDVLFRRKLDDLLARYRVTNLNEDQVRDLSRAWRRLDPWPDTVLGLQRLKSRYLIAPLSNGSFITLTQMAKRGGMPWDCIISTELRQTFKPDKSAYLLAADLLELQPEEVMLVAAHDNDLKAAQAAGLHTAHVPRPLEWGSNAPPLKEPDVSFDFVARDFVDLARQLGIP